MNSRKWVGLFMKTLVIGAVACLVVSFFVEAHSYQEVLKPFNIIELIGLIVFFIGLGLVFSVISQTGFFAYLFLNRFGYSLFRGYWPLVQVLLVAFVVFDLVYFPYQETKGTVSIFWYMLMAASILIYGWIIAWIKAKQTKSSAFVPALFLMVVMTTLEWVPGLQTKGTTYAWLMIFPLLLCNTYQLLILHKLTSEDKAVEDTRKKGKQTSIKGAQMSKA